MFQPSTSRFMRQTRQTYAALCLTVLLFVSASSPFIPAQNAPTPRKLIYKVVPKYPRELRQNEIGGVVRLSISISPNGSVGKISPIGGNPVLVDAATVAVRQWKYVPADHPTTTEVQLDFIPH